MMSKRATNVILWVLGLLLPWTASALTTTPISVIPTVEQAVPIYDISAITVGSDCTLPVLEMPGRAASLLGQVAGFVAARGTVKPGQTGTYGDLKTPKRALSAFTLFDGVYCALFDGAWVMALRG